MKLYIILYEVVQSHAHDIASCKMIHEVMEQTNNEV